MVEENESKKDKKEGSEEAGTEGGLDALKVLLGAAAVGAGVWFLTKLMGTSGSPGSSLTSAGGEDYPILRGVCPHCLQSSHPFRITAIARDMFTTLEPALKPVRPKPGIVYLPFECYLCNRMVTNCGRCGVRPVKHADLQRTCAECLARGDLPSDS
jgi:hypothetical protein